MKWTLTYGGQSVLVVNDLAAVERHTARIEGIMREGGGWWEIQYPQGDGIAQSRFYLSPGVAVGFVAN
jgi:hypothetical protein